MYTDEQLEQVESDEHEITLEALVLLFSTLVSTKTELENELRRFYQKYGKDGVVTYAEARKWVSDKDKRKRMNVLMLFISERFASALADMTKDFEKMITAIIYQESKFFDIDLIPQDLNLKWGYDKLTWQNRLENDVMKWTALVRADVKQSILQRKHLDDILKELEERFNSMETVLEALGISETTATGTIARHEIFKALGVSRYKIYTREDERRCELCGGMHGVTFPMTEHEPGVTASPFHTRCRCWEVPIME